MEVNQTEETGLDKTVDLSEEEEVVEVNQEGQLADGSQIQLEFSKETAGHSITQLSQYCVCGLTWTACPGVFFKLLPLFLKNKQASPLKCAVMGRRV